ncbi:MAG: amidohydrolase family protein [Acidobacteria bacterium]|nr:amidohydrolase family protein [Acidobacteriota bacterium]
MKIRIGFVTALLLVSASATAQTSTSREEGLRRVYPASVALTNARIVVSPGQVIENGTLIVRDGRVEAVGSGARVPGDLVAIDLEGATVMPGFVDPYTEYGLSNVKALNPKKEGDAPKYDATRIGPDAWNDAIHSEIDWVERFEPSEKDAEALRKRGVTTVQSAKMDGIFRGRGFVANLGSGLPAEMIVVPRSRMFLSFDKGSSSQEYPSSLMGSIALIRQTFYDAAWWERAAGTPERETNVALEAIAGYDGPWIFAADDELTLLRAAAIAREHGLQLIHVGSQREYQRLDAIAALGQPIILPLKFPDKPAVSTIEDELDVDLADMRHWERAPANPAALAERGVRFAFTGRELSDKDFFASLRTVVERGLSSEVALAALTTIPAALAGADSEVGSLQPGRHANFLVVEGDLFTDEEARIREVWVEGRRLSELVPRRERDLTGTYEVEIGGETYLLEVSGERGAIKGTLVRGEQRIDVVDLRESLDSLQFGVPMDDVGIEGVARFSISEIEDEVSGQVTLPGGMPAGIMLSRRAPLEEPEEETGEEEEIASELSTEEEGVLSEPTIVSRLTWPNVAFGYEAYPAQETVLVRNATIWTLEGEGKIENADLLVSDGKISAVGTGLRPPSNTRVIDATGKHVTPGMIDEHSHLAISRGVNEGSHAVTAEVRIGDVVNSDDIGMYRALAGGTTTAQLLHGSANPIGGQAQVIKFRWGLLPEELKFDAAPPSIKFALGENVKQSNWGEEHSIRYPQTRMGVYTLMKDRFLRAREYGAERARFDALSRRDRQRAVEPRRDLQLETLREILDGERFVHSHSYVQSEILMLMRLAEELGFRIQTFTHILEGYKVAPEMAAHGAGASTFSDWWAYKFEVYDAIPYNPCLMHEAGVVTSINSDSSELIRRLNQEAGKSVMYCGMDEVEALKLATLNPAKQLRVDHRVGSLAQGKDADFVIWSDHPLSTYSRAEQTWVDGRPMFTLERDARLRREVNEERAALVQKVLRAGKGKKDDEKKEPAGPEPDWHCEDVVDIWKLESAGGAR